DVIEEQQAAQVDRGQAGRSIRSRRAGGAASDAEALSERSINGTWRPRPRPSARKPRGVAIPRHFTRAGEDPFDSVAWELRSARIANERGETLFEQADVEVPAAWSALATNVVVSKYFRGHVGTPERERSVKQLIGRVVSRIGEWGEAAGYFATPADAQTFRDELTSVLVNQRASFNSPVWFNL